MTIYEICDRCGKMIKEGDIRYIVRLLVADDDGGVVSEPITDEEISEIISKLNSMASGELEQQVYEEREYILCRKCKQTFLKSPFGHSHDGPPDDEVRKTIH